MKSLKSRDNTDLSDRAFFTKGFAKDELNLNTKVFTEDQRNYFENKIIVKSNQTDHVKTAENRSLNGILSIDYLLKNSKFIETRQTNWLDKVFNAHTLQDILTNLLVNKSYPIILKKYSDDYTTSELARLYFEIAMDYLKQKTFDDHYLHEDIDRLSARFKEHSHNNLKDESYKKQLKNKNGFLTENKESALKNKLSLELKRFNEFLDSDEYTKIGKDVRELRMQEISMRFDIATSKKKKSKNQIIIHRNYKKRIEQLEIKQITIYEQKHKNIDQIEKQLNKKYDHLQTVYCTKNPHVEFIEDMKAKKYPIPKDLIAELDGREDQMAREYGFNLSDSITRPMIEKRLQ